MDTLSRICILSAFLLLERNDGACYYCCEMKVTEAAILMCPYYVPEQYWLHTQRFQFIIHRPRVVFVTPF